MIRPAIEWTEPATRQLDQARDYIALSNSEEVAERITLQIVTTIQQLTAFPMSGRSGRVPNTRELVISNSLFIAAYAVEHAHRDPRHLPRRTAMAGDLLSRALHSFSHIEERVDVAREAYPGKISLSAHSILSTSSRITRIDCWFFKGWASGVIPSRAPRI
jgi:toxin ParE1/3/4